ncbi:unnamed protein product [Caenorhabditis brenneri]
MLSKFNNFFSETNIDPAPPSEISSVTSGSNYEHKPVEVTRSRPPAASSLFEPAEKQRHFGILRYTVNKRFNKLMLIGLVNIILIVGVLLLVFLVFLRSGDNSGKAPSTPAPYPVQTDACNTHNVTTFLFAYSNDFEPSTVLEVLDSVNYYQMISKHYTHFGAVRFDTVEQEEFYLHGNWSDINTYVNAHLPDPSLSFKDPKNGSDVLAMIDRFTSNDQVPICGSRIFLLVKRYPSDNKYSELVTKLRQYHTYLSLLVSTDQSGGQYPEILYEIASQTNGMCGFDSDKNMRNAVTYLETISYPYLIYAVNPYVSQQGRAFLKPLLVPDETFYAVLMTIQNYAPVEQVKNVTLSWSLNSAAVGSIGTTWSPEIGNHMSWIQNFKRESYNMTLDYAYSVAGSRRLQIRVYGTDYSSVDQWQPYDD